MPPELKTHSLYAHTGLQHIDMSQRALSDDLILDLCQSTKLTGVFVNFKLYELDNVGKSVQYWRHHHKSGLFAQTA